MDNPIVVSGIIMLMSTMAAGLIGGIFRLATSNKNGRVKNGRLAINPEDARSGDLASSFWLQHFQTINNQLVVHTTKLESFGSKLDQLVTEMATANQLLKDILKVLMENRIR